MFGTAHGTNILKDVFDENGKILKDYESTIETTSMKDPFTRKSEIQNYFMKYVVNHLETNIESILTDQNNFVVLNGVLRAVIYSKYLLIR